MQSEKLAQLGAMVLIGHEIANPINLVNMSAGETRELVEELEESLRPLFGEEEEVQVLWKTYEKFLTTSRVSNDDMKLGADRLKDLSMALRTQSRMN